MKPYLPIIALTLLSAACDKADIISGKEDGYCAPATAGLTKAQETVAAGQIGFDIDFFKKAAGRDEGDVVVSPFSMAAAWSMAAAGAAGDTYSEIARTLGFNECTSEEIGTFYNKSLEAMRPVSDSAKLCVANSIWVDRRCVLKDEFVSEAENLYSAKAASIDLTDLKSIDYINDWVNEKSFGMIEKLLDESARNSAMIMTNAVYFDAPWTSPYDYEIASFINVDGIKDKRPFFCGYGGLSYNLEYSENQDRSEPRAISLPFASSPLRMVFVLPPENTSINDYIAELNDSKWNRLMSSLSLSDHPTYFSIPEFTTSTSVKEPKAILKEMGISRAFSDADFSRAMDASIFVSNVFHKSKIDVSHEGVKAAAASAIEFKFISSGQQFELFAADRPFIYAIVEPTTQSVLFMGVVRK